VDDVGPALLEVFDEQGRSVTYTDGEPLILGGDLIDDVFRIDRGLVKVTSVSRSGREVVLELRTAGSIVGEMASLLRRPRTASVIAVGPVEARAITASTFASCMQRAEVARDVASHLAVRLHQASEHQLEMGTFDATERVAAILLRLAGGPEASASSRHRLAPRVSQQHLADYAGLSRDAVVRALRTLRASGWVETGRQTITITNLDALRQLVR
jgi:CRP-like cAMP-binding protein